VFTIVTVPGVMPVTTPVDAPTVAIEGLLDVQEPGDEKRVIVLFTHTCDGPVIAMGNGSTVSVTDDWQPATDDV